MYFMRTLMRIGMASGLSCKVVITKVIKAFVFASPFQSIKCISNFNIVGNCCSLSSKQRKQGVLMNIPMMFFSCVHFVQANGSTIRVKDVRIMVCYKKKWYQANLIEEVDPKDGTMLLQ